MSVIIVEPASDLATINTLIAQQEDFLQGPLTRIGNKNGKTTLQIDDLGGKPQKHAEVTTANPPVGAVLINTAKIFIAGTLTTATAYRNT